MRPLAEMSAFEACALLRQSITGDDRPEDRWRLQAYGFIGRRMSLRWARLALRYARIALENREGVEAIGWLQTAERWRAIGHEYPARARELARKALAARLARAHLRADARAALTWPSRAAAERG